MNNVLLALVMNDHCGFIYNDCKWGIVAFNGIILPLLCRGKAGNLFRVSSPPF